MQAQVYDKTGKKVSKMALTPEIFEAPTKPQVLRLVVEYLRAGKRQVLAHTKTRGERRGGGRKPWKQKGTGNARHGSRRSPIWRKGGVVFGPRKDRNFKISVNAKVRRQAFLGALSQRAAEDAVLVLQDVPSTEIKTKPFAQLFNKLPIKRRAVFVLPSTAKNALRSVKNIENINPHYAHKLNALDVLADSQIVFTQDALDELHKILNIKGRALKIESKRSTTPQKSTSEKTPKDTQKGAIKGTKQTGVTKKTKATQ